MKKYLQNSPICRLSVSVCPSVTNREQAKENFMQLLGAFV